MGIKINNQSIAKLYLGNIAVKRAYSNGSIVYDTGGSQPCFEVVTNISSATGNYVDVYVTSEEKWYKKNNLNQFEEYGVMPYVNDLSTTTRYVGKLVVLTTDSHEYKWNGSSWVDLGEISDVYTEYEYVQGNGTSYVFTDYISKTNSRAEIDIQGRLASSASVTTGEASIFGGIQQINGVYQRFTFMYPGYNTDGVAGGIRLEVGNQQLASHDNDILSRGIVKIDKDHAYINNKLLATFNGEFTGNQARVMIFTKNTYDSTNNTNTAAGSPYTGKIYSVKIYEDDTLVRNYVPAIKDGTVGFYETVNHVMWGSYVSTPFTVGGSSEEHGNIPEEYDTKVAPANNVHYNTLEELEMMECPWNGMVATIGANYDLYLYTNNRWIPVHNVPCYEVVETITDATGDYVDVYATDTSKWYKKNNLSQYEEYGIMPEVADLSTLTYYVGKLAICTTDSHEYKWNGSQWVDLGEADPQQNYKIYENLEFTNTYSGTSYYFDTNYNLNANITKVWAKYYLTRHTADFVLYGLYYDGKGSNSQYFGSISNIGCNWRKDGTEYGTNYWVSFTGSDFAEIEYNKNNRTIKFNGNTKTFSVDHDVATGKTIKIFTLPSGTAGKQINSGDKFYGYKVWEGDTLAIDLVPALRKSDNSVGLYDKVRDVFLLPQTNMSYIVNNCLNELPEEYDTKVAPPNNVHYNTLVELELMVCPWEGMQATVGDDYDLYLYWNNHWIKCGTPCFEVVTAISQASGDYVDVYNKSNSKWYKKNNLNQYEEYGIIERTDDLSSVTYYVGKLVILTTDNHEYKWDGSQWIDLGECEGEAILPSGYTQYQAIANNGNAYINSGYVPSNKTRILADIQITTSTTYGRLWGSGQWNEYRSIHLDYENNTTGTIHGKWGTENTWNVNSNVRGDFNRHVYDMYDHYLYRDGDLVLTFASGTFTSQYNLAIFTYYNYGTPGSSEWINGRLYSFKIYDNGTLVRDFIPCKRDSDSKAGAYDIVNNVFYPSSSSNQFSTYGDPFNPLIPVEDYDTKVAPSDDVHYNTIAELLLAECPWIGMVATVGEDYTTYVYTENGWEQGELPLDLPYLRFTPSLNATFTFSQPGLKYSIEGHPWKDLEANTPTDTVLPGSYIIFKGSLTPISNIGIGTFSATGDFAASGNAMSLLFDDEFADKLSLSGKDYAFRSLFSSNTNLKSVTNTLFPATTLSSWCYYYTFYGCTGLTSIPSGLLPATTLSERCYCSMFENSGLKSIPSGLLPATTLGSICYASMFYGTKISSIPSGLLPATTLAHMCYANMFTNCTSLTTIPENLLPATTLANSCYTAMFAKCSNLVTVPENLLPATTNSYDYSYDQMFSECSKLEEAPRIKVTTATGTKCMRSMFYKCSKLKYLVCDLLTEPSLSITDSWLYGVYATGTFYKNPNATWDQTITKGANTVPTGWNIVSSDTEPNYLTFTVVDPNGSTFRIGYSGDSTTEYSIDNGSWTTLSGGVNSPLVQENSSIRFRGTITPKGNASQRLQIYSSGKFNVSGNILTLLYGANYREGQISKANTSYIFYRMFYNNTNVVDAGNLILPVFSVAPDYGFQDMFRGCTSLTTSPVMKADTTGQYSFRDVFNRCSSLTTVNEIYCGNTNTESHVCMFENCTSLINVPNINVTTSKGWSVQWMFRGCTNLQSVVLKGNWGSSYSAAQVFNGCTNLTSVTYLGSSSPSLYTTENWLRDVPANGTFYMSQNYSWDRTVARDANGVPASWTIVKIDPSSV